MNGQDECDLYGDYSFTDDKVDLDAFFGEDIKLKVAQEIDSFYFDFDPYEYRDCIPAGCTREDVLASIHSGLSDKSYVPGIIQYFKKVLENNAAEHSLSARDEQKVRCFVSVLTAMNARNKSRLDDMVNNANSIKDQQARGDQGPTPEIQQ